MLGDPASLAILVALTAGSVAARQQGQKAIVKQQNQYAEEENQRQTQYGNRSRELVAEGARVAGAENQIARREEIAQDLGEAYTSQAPSNLVFEGSSPAPASREVRQEAARQMNRSLGEGREFAKRTARMQSLPTLQGYTGMDLGDIYSQLGTQQNFSTGSSAALPYELQAAHQAAEPWNALSDVLGAGSDIYGLYKMTSKAAPVKRTPESRTFGGGQARDPSIWR